MRLTRNGVAAFRAIRQEFMDRDLDLVLAPAAIDAAAELAPYPRETWAKPTSSWEQLVVSLALVLRRLSGAGLPRAARLRAVREVVEMMQRERVA